MSINLKIRLFKGKTHADGTHPIQLQFYLNGKEKRKGIYNCYAKDWDEKTCRVKSKVTNSSYINNLISEKYAEYERELLNILNGKSKPNDFFEVKKELTLDDAIGLELDRFVREKKPMTHARIKSYATELQLYFDSKSTLLKDIDLKWFERYGAILTNDLISGDKLIRKGNIGSTAQKKIKTIRRIIEKFSEIRLSEGVKDFRIASKKTVKEKLTPTELSALETLVLPAGGLLDISRDIFLMQIYLRGCRIGSLLKAYSDQFKDGRYSAANDGGKNNVGSKLISKAQVIVNKYEGKNKRLFPLFKFTNNPEKSEFENKRLEFKHKHVCTSIVNNNLKIIAKKAGITKPLSSHIARHTFALMAIKKINNPMVTMELLGHSSLAVHQVYLNDIRKEDALDAAADDIFS